MAQPIDRMELPKWYDDNRLVLMVVTPYSVFLYWELAFSQNQDTEGHQLAARLFELSMEKPSEQPTLIKREPLPPYTENWYFNDLQPDRYYRAEIGWEENGVFYSIIKSNVVNIPPANPTYMSEPTKWQTLGRNPEPPITRPAQTTTLNTLTVNELLQDMSFYMGIHQNQSEDNDSDNNDNQGQLINEEA